ncbi:MATE family efflux transporter [Lacrimispora amygdalina]|jgi:putative MATE family efflux protein|uniref:MATE family efflux transporter n=1 Tax=Lacrimispora amygdalina TaxID=253257 RepID=UPI000BE40023|nr:MATE family efflux transporter [Lacrimispora amygdalina]
MNKLIGNKAFYKKVLIIAIPIMIQNGITNFVSLLDNIMVGMVGTGQMSGVAIVNQLIFVFNVSIFGIVSGAGIFGAQFYGSGKHDGVRHTFRFKFLFCLLLSAVAALIFYFYGENLIYLYLHGEDKGGDLSVAMSNGRRYMLVMMLGLLPFALEQAYTSTLRECGETVIPMKAGIAAVLVNVVLNYILIFGKFGVPAFGVMGAGIATVAARYIETVVVIVWTHKHKKRFPFIEGAYKSMHIPMSLIGKIFVKGTPLIVNEALWASGMAVLMQCYSVRGLTAVAGLNISNTIGNVFNVVYIALGVSVSIIVGQLLGAGKMEEARDTDTKLIAFSVASCAVMGTILAIVAPLFPMIYNTTDEVKNLAVQLIRILALLMPMNAFMNVSYFTLRSGGKTVVTFFFDSVFMWVASIPAAYLLSRYTQIPIVPLYFMCQMVEIIKCIIGFVLVKKGVWIQNIVLDQEA